MTSFTLPVQAQLVVPNQPHPVQPPAPPSPSVHSPPSVQRWLSTIQAMRGRSSIEESLLDQLARWITSGIELPLISHPQPAHFSNTPAVDDHFDAVQQRINDYAAFGAIKPFPSAQQPSFLQPLHLIAKPDAKPRIVLDLSRNLNQFLHPTPFHYSSVDDAVELATQDCWFGKLDLANCFLSFDMDERARQFLTFQFNGRTLQFTRLPFGLATAPYQCTQLLSVPAFCLEQMGLKFIRYIDDFLFIESSPEGLAKALDTATNIFQQFGLVTNPAKRVGPVKQITFLGIRLDSEEQSLSCPPERIKELSRLLRETSSASSISIRQAQSLVGKLSFAARVLHGARPFMRRLYELVSTHKHRSRHSRISINDGWRADCLYWLSHLERWNGGVHWRCSEKAPVVFATDASVNGFGFYIEHIPSHLKAAAEGWPKELQLGVGYAGEFDSTHSHLHQSHKQISWAEMFAVVAAIVTFGSRIRDQAVLFLVDNQTDVAIINRQSTRSSQLSGLLRRLFSEVLVFNLALRASHRRGDDNTLADFLSRPCRGDRVKQWQAWYPQQAHRLSVCISVNSLAFNPMSESPSSISS